MDKPLVQVQVGARGDVRVSGDLQAGETVLARLMESQIWHQPSCVGGGLSKGTMASAGLATRHLNFFMCTTDTFQAATPVMELGVSLSSWVRVWVPLEELLRASATFFTNSVPTGFCSQKLWGLVFLALESCAGGPGVALGILAPLISCLNSYPYVCGASLFHIHTPSSLDGCGFFSSSVVRLLDSSSI